MATMSFPITVLLALSLFLQACGPSIPSDNQARQVVNESFADLKAMGAKLIDFRKLNGELLEGQGQKLYIYHFLGAAELPTGVAWVKGGLEALGGGYFTKDTGRNDWGLRTERLPAGTTAVRRGRITFRLTEQGWLSRNLPDTVDNGYCTRLSPDSCYKEFKWDTPM